MLPGGHPGQPVRAPILGRQRISIGARWPADYAASMVAYVAASLQGRSSIIGPSTAKTPRSWSVTMR